MGCRGSLVHSCARAPLAHFIVEFQILLAFPHDTPPLRRASHSALACDIVEISIWEFSRASELPRDFSGFKPGFEYTAKPKLCGRMGLASPDQGCMRAPTFRRALRSIHSHSSPSSTK